MNDFFKLYKITKNELLNDDHNFFRYLCFKHIDLIEKQKTQRQAMYDAERSQELAQFQEAERREEYRKKVIQEARKRLLQEHAARLQGFIPGKLFQNSEEFEAVKASSSQSL